MIKEFMKRFSAPADNEAKADTPKEEVTMTTQVEPTGDMQALLDAATASLAAKEQELAELVAKFTAIESALNASEAAKAELAAQAKAKVVAARKEKLEAVLGTEKAPVMLASLENLDDAAFETVLSGMAATYDKEAKSALFSEVGVAAEAKAPVAEEDPVKRLAALVAAELQTK